MTIDWETMIGVEIHVQLATQSKLFSAAHTLYGAAPNSQAHEIDLALPGTLPVLNQQSVSMAVKFGIAIGAHINQRSTFDRKNYFYPDLPKGYQISQYYTPIIGNGKVSITSNNVAKTIRIHHAHLEEDAGKLLHDQSPHQSAVDLNRAGMPLLEIVSEPDMCNAHETVAYLKQIHQLVRYIGISDGKMAEGSMRFDINVSVRPAGSTKLGQRTEIKNINSFRFVEQAIDYEVQRHISLLRKGQSITRETRLYDEKSRTTRSMREKEADHDYRYFTDPDLPPVIVSEKNIDALRTGMPELPQEKSQRFIKEYGIPPTTANFIATDFDRSQYFEELIIHCEDKLFAANTVVGMLTAQLNKTHTAIADCPVAPKRLGELLNQVCAQTISNTAAQHVLTKMWESNQDPKSIIDREHLAQLSDSDTLLGWINEVIVASPKQVAQYRVADENKRKKLLGYFVGQAMRLSKGQANPKMLNQMMHDKLLDK